MSKESTEEELQLQIQYALMEQLSSTQRKQSQLLSLLGECIFECDDYLSFLYTNPAWEHQLGYSEGQLANKKFGDILLGPDKNILLQKIAAWIRSPEKCYDQEVLLANAEGNSHWFELRLLPCSVRDKTFIGLLFDIDKRKQLENKLNQSKEDSKRLSLVAKHTNNLVVITDPQGNIVWVNSSFEQLSGYRFEEIKGLKPGSFLQGPLTDMTKVKEMSDAVAKMEGFHTEIINYNRDGEPYWVEIDAAPVIDESGSVLNFIAIESDIGQRVKAEQAAAASEFNYRTVVDNISEVVLRMSPRGELLFVNHSWSQWFDIDDASEGDKLIITYIESSYQNVVESVLAKYRLGDKNIHRLDLQLEHADGTKFWVEMTTVPVFTEESGVLLSIAATLINIDERVLAAKILEESKQNAEALAEAKTRFLANISHEIRTPLNAVIGVTDLLSDTGLSKEQTRYVEMVRTSGDTLLSLVEDVLTYSRYEATAMTIDLLPLELNKCIEEAVDIVSQSAVNKNISLVIDIADDLPLSVMGDKMRLRQIVINLLSNAIKFTENGFVTITAKSESKTNDAFILKLDIEDSGIGIETDRLEKLFEPFVQADVSTTRRYGGSGLGLAICRQICDAANGDIYITSEVGKGSIFHVSIPFNIIESELDNSVDDAALNDVDNVWIIGDMPKLNHAIENTLSRLELNYRTFKSSDDVPKNAMPSMLMIVSDTREVASCVELMGESHEGQPYLVVMDLTRKGKTLEVNKANHLYLNGPFKPSNIAIAFEALDGVIDEKSIHQLEVHTKFEQDYGLSLKGKTILVVEDNEFNLILTTEYLHARECKVIEAKNGIQAIESLKENPEINLVLMDIQMPEMDGVTATKKIRSSDQPYKNVPIIAVTADAVFGDRERFLEMGMNDYLSKPLFRGALYSLVDQYLFNCNNASDMPPKLERILHSKSELTS